MLLAIKIQIWIYIQDMYGTGTFFFNSNNYNQISRLTHISFKQMQATSKWAYTTTTTTVYFWIASILTAISDFTYI